jgi:type IV pilus assembly protein PilO
MNIAKEFGRLKKVEWGELDIKESGNWPVLLQLICGFALLVLTFAGMYWYLVAPKVESLSRAQGQEQKLLNEYRVKASKAAHLTALQAQVEELDGRLNALVEMLPSDAEIPSLLSSISQAGIANQLKIESIRRRPDVRKDFYIERPFDIRVTGDYHRISSFVAALADLPRIVTQHDFTLKPASQGGLLQLSLVAQTYSYEHSPQDNGSAEGDK